LQSAYDFALLGLKTIVEDLLLGSFEILRALFSSPTLPFEIGPGLVIEVLLHSFAYNTIAHMASPAETFRLGYPDPYF
jgi:hypothetical protein